MKNINGKYMDKEMELMFEYSDKFLDIARNADDMDNSDLQGAIEAQVRMLIRDAKNL